MLRPDEAAALETDAQLRVAGWDRYFPVSLRQWTLHLDPGSPAVAFRAVWVGRRQLVFVFSQVKETNKETPCLLTLWVLGFLACRVYGLEFEGCRVNPKP